MTNNDKVNFHKEIIISPIHVHDYMGIAFGQCVLLGEKFLEITLRQKYFFLLHKLSIIKILNCMLLYSLSFY